MKKAIIVLLSILFFEASQAQNDYDLNFKVTQNDIVNGGAFKVMVQIRSAGADFKLGSSNFRFNYNDNRLAFVAVTPNAANTFSNPPFYSPITGTGSGNGFVSINITLGFPGFGSTVSSSWIDVAEVEFTITDRSLPGNFDFRPLNNTAGNSVGFIDDEATNLGTAGTAFDFVNWDGSVWSGGNGVSGAPDDTDGAKHLQITSGVASIIDEAHVDRLSVASGTTLNIDPMAGTNGALRVLSDLAIVNGSVYVNADINGYGQYIGPSINATVQQYVGNNMGWRHLGFPVSGAVNNLSLGGSPMNYATSPSHQRNTFYFDNTSFQWTAVPNSSWAPANSGVSVFVGGVYFPVTNGVISYSGTTNDGAQSSTYSFASSPVGDPGYDGWNLIGNPYPSNIDWNTIDDQDGGSVFTSYSVWDNGVYRSWNGTVATNGGTRYIAPGQSFWVKSTGNNGVSFDFARADRTFSGGNAFFGNFKKASSVEVISLTVTSPGGLTDETVIYFPAGSISGFDPEGGDAHKPWNNLPNSNLYSLPENSDEKLAINAFGPWHVDARIRLGFSNDSTFGKQHTIELDGSRLNTAWGDIYLEDLADTAANWHNMGTPYTFLNDSSVTENRFVLHFKPKNFSVEELHVKRNYRIYYDEKDLMLQVYSPFIKWSIFNSVGQKIAENMAEQGKHSLSDYVQKSGVYTLQLEYKGFVRGEKVVILH